MKYFLITPAKNEEKYISFTLESMINQSLKPLKWIIVDDGSTDKTKEIAEAYAGKYNWIEVVSIDNKQEKKLYGSKVVRAFNFGYNLIKDQDFDFIVKLDADLSFSPDYFQQIANAFQENKSLGICAGYLIEKEGDLEKKMARHPYVQGPIKSIRYSCWKEIGGFAEANGWDGLDQHKAKYLGWEVKNIPLEVIHHRIQTTEYRSLQFFYNNGATHYRQGNDLLLSLIRFIVLLKQKPHLLASFNYLKGYLSAAFSKQPMLVDEGLARYIRSYHYKRLFSFRR